MGNILIVDDEKEMCQVLSDYFQSEGYEVDIAFDAYDALNKIRQHKYQYLLVDLVLPGSMNGIDVIKNTKKYSPNTYIVAYSGFCDEDISEKVTRAGANKFITKPFKQQELFNLMFNRH